MRTSTTVIVKVIYPCAAIISPAKRLNHCYMCQVRMLQPDFFEGVTELLSDMSIDIHVDDELLDTEDRDTMLPLIAAAQSWYTKYAPQHILLVERSHDDAQKVSVQLSDAKKKVVMSFTPIHVFLNPITREYVVQFVLQSSLTFHPIRKLTSFMTLKYSHTYVSKCLSDVAVWDRNEKRYSAIVSFSARAFREAGGRRKINVCVLNSNTTNAAIVRGLINSAVKDNLITIEDIAPGTICYFTRINRNTAALTLQLRNHKEDVT